MVASRTGTAHWKRIVREARQHALEQGQTACTLCGQGLDWDYPRRPESAVVDHIIPHARGGTDTLDNVRVICNYCNASRGNGRPNKRKPRRIEFTTSVDW